MTWKHFFHTLPRAAVAFSGGTDSALLLWAAKRYGCPVRAYYGKTAFQPRFEYEDALRLTRELGVPMTVVELDVLSLPQAAANGPERCYFCKQALFTRLWEAARRDGLLRPAGRHQRLRRCRGPARHAGPGGAGGALPPAGVRADQGPGPPPCPGRRGCSPGTSPPTPVWPPASPPAPPSPGGPGAGGAGGGRPARPGPPGLPAAAVPRGGPDPGDPGAAAPGSGAAGAPSGRSPA